jgi:hypothetical protein
VFERVHKELTMTPDVACIFAPVVSLALKVLAFQVEDVNCS